MTSTVDFVRRARLPQPLPPGGELVLSPPPEIPRAVPQNLLVRLLPVVMMVAVIGMISLMFVTGGRGALANPLYLMFPLMMVMSMVGMLASGGRGGPGRAAELNEDRKDYLRYLGRIRGEVAATVATQRAHAQWSHPSPAALAELLGGPRMWERRPSDADFGQVRLGLGTHRLGSTLVPPEVGPAEDLEPVAAGALRRFVHAFATVADLPTAVAVRSFPAIGIGGPPDAVRALARAVVGQLCTFHGPDHLRVVIVSDDPLADTWDWAKWLPHLAHPEHRDRLGPARMSYPSLALAESELADELAQRGRFVRSAPPEPGRPHLLVILDGGPVTGEEELACGAGRDGVTVLDLAPDADSLARRRGLLLSLDGPRLAAHTVAGVERFATADALSSAQAEALARGMARYRLSGGLLPAGLELADDAADPGLLALLGIPGAEHIDPLRRWTGRRGPDRLRVPIGFTDDGTPVDLDLKESSQGGMGPHGLCIGATGSGNPEPE